MPGALDGLLVVDLSHYIAGPLTAMVLGDLGAEVIRVDPPDGPRWAHPANALLQRGKKSIVLDLGQADDRATAGRLIDRADVLVESFRPGRLAARAAAGIAARRPTLNVPFNTFTGLKEDRTRAGYNPEKNAPVNRKKRKRSA